MTGADPIAACTRELRRPGWNTIMGQVHRRMRAVAVMWALSGPPALAADIVGVPRISDGDTVEIAGTKIRLEGIDAPETDQICLDAKGAGWACGAAARDALERRAGGRPWTCSSKGQDKYGRTLAARTAAGQDVERWMVRAGWALAFVRFSQAYVADEKAARDDRGRLGDPDPVNEL